MLPATCGNVHVGGILFSHPRPPLKLHQSIFMFPLCFSSSSSLSSTPPSLDSISEFDHVLSDISEDDDLVVDVSASHQPQWTLPSDTPPSFSDQLLADFDRLLKNSPTSHPTTGSQTNSSEVLGVGEGCQANTRATVGVEAWQSRFSLTAVVKCLVPSLFLCFLSLLGKNCSKILTMKLSSVTATVSKLTSGDKSAARLMILINRSPKFMDSLDFHQILNYVALKWARLVAILKSSVPPNCSSSVALFWKQSRLNWACPLLSTLSSLPMKVFSVTCPSSYLTLHPLPPSFLPTSVLCYLRRPSPLFLPGLLTFFLLVVMLTASQSLVLALILATPLGLTLCCLENMVSSQRRAALLPVFAQDDDLNSGFSLKASPQKLKHSPPHIRHQVQKNTDWIQEMCDPAA